MKNQNSKIIIEKYLKFIKNNSKEKVPYEEIQFCKTKSVATKLANDVLTGVKYASSSLYYIYEKGEKVLPKIGNLSVVLDGDDNAVCIIKCIATRLTPFWKVSSLFAEKEGEGDLTLESWKEIHRIRFKREMERYPHDFNEEMTVICQEFEVVYK